MLTVQNFTAKFDKTYLQVIPPLHKADAQSSNQQPEEHPIISNDEDSTTPEENNVYISLTETTQTRLSICVTVNYVDYLKKAIYTQVAIDTLSIQVYIGQTNDPSATSTH